ncbi:hypothetical protein AVEN_203013-1 [Araneus ventricosus]|uniref:Uncharacterized protein n=1 Tax=Araneus ventricosus TaxID=182803 RepID=A0A4Y2EQJ0_ARAVE|nr:hypothetical protein AVEN_203013-1 [Araneus ventricosus]
MGSMNLPYSPSYKNCSGVEDITSYEKPSHIAITVDADSHEIEDFDHIDELIMYFVSFLRRLRRIYMSSKFVYIYISYKENVQLQEVEEILLELFCKGILLKKHIVYFN